MIEFELNSTMEKRDVIHGGAQLTSLDPENLRSDFYDGKNVTSLTPTDLLDVKILVTDIPAQTGQVIQYF